MPNSTTDLVDVTKPVDPSVAQQSFGLTGAKTGYESALSSWAGPYVTEMLGKGRALADQPYEAYTGALTAAPSQLQQQAFQGVGNLVAPTEQMGAYTPETFDDAQASRYMNPFIQQSLQPQLQELQRQQEIKRIANAGRMAQAGAYGGGRQAVLESELDRAGLEQAGRLTGTSYVNAYDRAQQQFNTEQDRQRQAQELANKYGLAALERQAGLGATQRGIETEGIQADRAQFDKELGFPYKQTQYMQGLLQGLPLESQDFTYATPSKLEELLYGGAGASKGLEKFLGSSGLGALLGGSDSNSGILGALGNLPVGDMLASLFGTSDPDSEDNWLGSDLGGNQPADDWDYDVLGPDDYDYDYDYDLGGWDDYYQPGVDDYDYGGF